MREHNGPGDPGASPTAPCTSGVRRGPRSRLFAWGLSRAEDSQQRLYGEHRAHLFAELATRTDAPVVVEIGAGAGPTADYLPPGAHWIAVEPNVHFHARLQRAAADRRVEPEVGVNQLTIYGALAEVLPLADASADVVISTLVLCSVDDVPRALSEIRRVLKPGGQFLFMEHVGAPKGTWMRRFQRLVRGPWSWAADGCRPDRDTAGAIRAAGFSSIELANVRVPIGLASPHIRGVAVR